MWLICRVMWVPRSTSPGFNPSDQEITFAVYFDASTSLPVISLMPHWHNRHIEYISGHRWIYSSWGNFCSFGWSVPVHGPLMQQWETLKKKMGPEKSEALVGQGHQNLWIVFASDRKGFLSREDVTCLTHVHGSVAGAQFVSLLKRRDDEAKLVIPLSVTREQCYSVSRPMNTPDLTRVPLLFHLTVV